MLRIIQIDIENDDLKAITPGALKVLIALQLNPGANNAKLSDLTGYHVRQVQNLKRELERYHLLKRPMPIGEMTIDQKIARSALLNFGFDSGTADNLAMEYSPRQVDAAIQIVRQARGVANPCGLVIYYLRTQANLPPPTTFRERMAEFWTDGRILD